MERSEDSAQSLMRDLQRMVRARHALFHGLLLESGLTLQQFHLLMFMQARGRMTVSELGSMMMVSMPTASRMLNTLCGKGLVAKERDKIDRRLIYAELTERGRRIVGEVHEIQREELARVIDKIPAVEVEAFLATMRKIADELVSTLREDQPGAGCHREAWTDKG